MSDHKVQADIVMQVLNIPLDEIRRRDSALMLMSVTAKLIHQATPDEWAVLAERGITGRDLCEMGVTSSYNSRVLDLRNLEDCYNGKQRGGGRGDL